MSCDDAVDGDDYGRRDERGINSQSNRSTEMEISWVKGEVRATNDCVNFSLLSQPHQKLFMLRRYDFMLHFLFSFSLSHI